MKTGNFARVVRLALRYRWTVAASALCSLAVAVLWSANITLLAPLVEVVGQEQALDVWVDKVIASYESDIADFEAQLAAIDEKIAFAPQSDKRALDAKRRDTVDRATAMAWRLYWLRSVEPWVDNYLPHDPFRTLAVVVLALLAATIVKDFFMTCGSFLANRLAQMATFDLRKQFFRRTLRMDLVTFSEGGTSDLLSRFTHDTESIAGGIQTIFGRALMEPLKMIGCLTLAAYLCWRLLLVSLILAPLAGYLITMLTKTLKRANRKALEEMSALYAILAEAFGGVKVVKAFTMERHERRRFHVTSKKFFRKGMRIALFDGLINPVTEVMGITTICLAILLGAYLVMNHETHLLGIQMSSAPLSLSQLMMFFGLLAGASDPARRLTELFGRIQRASAAADRVYQMLDREPKVCDPPRPLPLPRHHRELLLERVSFRYTPGQPVLDDINLRIPFGETIAFVGANGCGKSTLVNLISRFYDPTAGRVMLDGTDLRDVRLRDLRRQIGLVTQETLLFDDTVYNNIRYGCPHASRQQVIEAAKQAHAHKFIEQKLESGYETVVGQGGNRLSGGQRQRIALARAILRDPAILILDEATSQIDLESEQLIHKVLEQFIRHRTTLIVTHRLATLALADRVAVLEGGRILDVGTHDQLLGRSELYRRLHQIQFRESA